MITVRTRSTRATRNAYASKRCPTGSVVQSVLFARRRPTRVALQAALTGTDRPAFEEPLVTEAKKAIEYGESLKPIPSPKSLEEEMREEIDKFFPPIPPLEGDPPP